MKKEKIIVIIVALFLLTLLGGCVRYDAKIEIDAAGNASIDIDAATSELLTALGGSDVMESIGLGQDALSKYEDSGFTVTEYSEDGYTGYRISRDGINLSDYVSDSNTRASTSQSLYEIAGDHIDFSLPLSSIDGLSDAVPYFSALRENGGSITVTLVLPFAPLEHNADKISEDGTVLTWDLLTRTTDDQIYVSLRLSDAAALIGLRQQLLHWIPVCAIVALLFLLILVFFLRKRRKRRTAGSDHITRNLDSVAIENTTRRDINSLRTLKESLDSGKLDPNEYEKRKQAILRLEDS